MSLSQTIERKRLVTLGEESHNSKLSNKLKIKCFGEGMEIFSRWKGGKKATAKREESEEVL
jgi:hypothetical protein